MTIIEPVGPLVDRVTEALRLRRSGEKVALIVDEALDFVLDVWLAEVSPGATSGGTAVIECGYMWRIALALGPTSVTCVLPNRHVGDHDDGVGHRIQRYARLNPQDTDTQQLDREVWDYLASMVADWRLRGSSWQQRALKLLAKLQERP